MANAVVYMHFVFLMLFHWQPQPPQSGFDVVLFFEVSSDEVFKRSSSADGMCVNVTLYEYTAWCVLFRLIALDDCAF